MNKGEKRGAVRLLLGLFAVLVCLTVNPISASASVRDNKGLVLIDNDVLKIKVNRTSLQDRSGRDLAKHDDYRGYVFDLEIINKHSGPINVDLVNTKVNGIFTGGSMLRQLNYYRPLNSKTENTARVGKGSTISRSAVISIDSLKSNKIEKVRNFDGYVKVTDAKGKVLLGEGTGSFHANLEEDASNYTFTADAKTSVRFDSKDNSSIKGSVVLNAYEVSYVGDDSLYMHFDNQNTDKTDYNINAKFSDGTSFFFASIKANGIRVCNTTSVPKDRILKEIEKGSTLKITYTLSTSKSTIATKKVDFDFSKLQVVGKDVGNCSIVWDNKRGHKSGSDLLAYQGENDYDFVLWTKQGSDSVDVPNDQITWSSSESDVATIDKDGHVSFKAPGGTIITALYKGHYSYMLVEVKEPSFTIDPCIVAEGKTEKLTFTVNPDSSGTKDITVKSENENILKIEGDTATGVSEGVAKVTATYNPGEGKAPLTTETLIRVVKNREESSDPGKTVTVKAPSLNASGYLFKEDNGFSLKLDSASMEGNSYCLHLTEKCSENENVTRSIYITSINGLKCRNSSYGYRITLAGGGVLKKGETQKHVIKLDHSFFSQLGTMEISEISGYVSWYSGSQSTKKYPFTIKPGTGQATSYVRKTPAGKELHINFSDMAVEVTSVRETVIDNKMISCVTLFITNKSTTKAYQLTAFLDQINNIYPSETLRFDALGDDIIYPGEKMYGLFSIPESDYFKTGRKIESLKISTIIRDRDNGVVHDETIVVGGLLQVASKMEGLAISCDDRYPYAGSDIQKLRVYDDDTGVPVDNASLSWTTSDDSIATVSGKGEVTPMRDGTVFITATDDEGRFGVTQFDIKPVKLSFRENRVQISENAYVDMLSQIETEPRSIKDHVAITSSNDQVVSMGSDGWIIGHKTGSATLTASYTSNGVAYTDTCDVIVSALGRVVLSEHELNLDMTGRGVYVPYDYLWLYDNTDDYADLLYEADWEVSNPAVVKVEKVNEEGVDAGFTAYVKVTPLSAGTATIRASYGSLFDTCTVTVTGQSTPVIGDEPGGEDNPENPSNPPSVTPGDKPESGTKRSTTEGTTQSPAPENGVGDASSDGLNSSDDEGSYAFKKGVVTGKNVKVIKGKAFRSYKKVKTINLKNCSVTNIEKNAFKGCKNLKNIKINCNSLETVVKGAFKGCGKDVKVTIFARNKKVYENATNLLKKGGLKSATYTFKKMK